MTPGRFIRKALARGWRPPGIECAVQFDRIHKVRSGIDFASFYSLDGSEYFEVRLGRIANELDTWADAEGIAKPPRSLEW